MRALVVEDDAGTARHLELTLKPERVVFERTASGEEALELVKIYDYDIVLLDLDLPDLAGTAVLRAMRRARVRTPVLILSGEASSVSKVACLTAGADDYLTKPFNKDELIARLRAVVRRAKGHATSVIRTGRMTINLDARTVEIDDKPLHVTSKEYAILELLSLRKGMTLTKEMFLDHLYGGVDEPELKIIDVFICKLRKKIAKLTGDDIGIQTVWGRGYALQEPGTVLAEAAEDVVPFRRAKLSKNTRAASDVDELDLLQQQLGV